MPPLPFPLRVYVYACTCACMCVLVCSYFGFQPVYQVEGDKLADLPHMLVWGGAGMRMDADMERMLRKWTRSLRALAQQGGKSDEARGSSESGISSSSSADTVRVGSEVADKTPR